MIQTATLIGKRLGAYELQALVGQGGMSSVYRGFDERLRRPVAVKVLSEAVAAQPGFVERFRQEALLLASLRHPHIVQIYDFGEQDGLTYMVQELLPGPTLEQRLRELRARGERADREAILAITAQLASALDAAHAAGIIHRDVKPGNALWNAAGALVLTDFGVAKNTLDAASRTQAGMVFGTPIYLSPEQAQGRPLTPASDIYALGVVLYELIAGRPPFEQGTSMEIVLDHLHTPPPPLRPLRPDLPPAAEAVVLRALSKNPAERFGSAGELARALESAWPPQPAPTAAPAAPAPERATPIWERPTTVSAPSPAPAPSLAPAAAPQPASSAVAPPRRRIPLLPLVAIAALLLFGAAAALRAGSAAVGTAPVAAPTAATRPTAAPVAAQPTAAPAPKPSPAPAPKPSPAPAPKPSPVPQPAPATADPLDQLQALLQAGRADGRAEKEGDRLLAGLGQVRQALDKNDQRRATSRLADLRRRVQDDLRSKKIAPDFAQQVLAGIDAAAAKYDLKLPA